MTNDRATERDQPKARRWPDFEAILVGAALGIAVYLVVFAGRKFIRGRMGDFAHFYYAAKTVLAGGDVHASGQGGYIYPPLLAFLFQPLASLSLVGAAVVWVPINAALLAAATVLAARESIRRFGAPMVRHPVAVITAIAFLLTLDKTRSTLNMGQTDCFVLLGFVLGLVWLERRPAMAGIALGMAANIKYLSLICVPYLLIRRRWAAAFWTVAATVGWALVPAVSLGWSENAKALRRAGAGLLGAVGVKVDAGSANISDIDWELSISVTSAISRALGPEAPGSMKAAAIGVAGLVALAAAWGIYASRGQALLIRPRPASEDGSGDATTALEWAGLIVASLAFGPQTTGRHLVLLLAVHAMAAAIVLRPGEVRRKWPVVAGVVVLQLGLTMPPGEEAFRPALEAWRSIGGAAWCMLLMYLTMLWAGLPNSTPGGGTRTVNPGGSRGIEPEGSPAPRRSSP